MQVAAATATAAKDSKDTKNTAPLAAVPEELNFNDSSFEDIGVPDIDGWFKPEIGLGFKGQVVGRIQIENDDGRLRDVVLVKLEVACKAVVDGAEGVVLEAGKILGVGVRAKLTDLLFYVEKKGRVMAQAMTQQKLRGNKTMWVFKVRGEKGKRSAEIPAPTPRLAADVGGDL